MKMNKLKFISLFVFIVNISLGQNVLEYEKKIQHIENYYSTDLEFINSEEKIKLYGTLIAPKNQYDKILIITPGSGMDTRNNHYLLAESLLEKNIAVFRYDERGVGQSEGKFSTSNYTITDMTNDLISIFSSIRNNEDFSAKKIGILGHSQGGMVVMSLIEKGYKPDFLIQWATPVRKYGEFIKYQLKTGVNKFDSELMFENDDKKIEIMDIFHSYFGGTSTENTWKEDLKISDEALKKAREHGYTNKNYNRFYYCNFKSIRHLIKKDFENVYANNTIPMLYIIGTDDKYVDPINEVDKLNSFKNDNIKIVVLENLNHYLTKGKISENTMYKIDSSAKNQIINWIVNQ